MQSSIKGEGATSLLGLGRFTAEKELQMQQANGVKYAQLRLRRVLVSVLQTGAVKKSGDSYIIKVDIITTDKHNIQEIVSR